MKVEVVVLYQTNDFQAPELRTCVKVQMAVLGSTSLISLMVSVDVKQHSTNNFQASEFRSCVKVEEAVLGSPSLRVRRVSVEVRQHSAPTFQERKDERAPKRQADLERGSWPCVLTAHPLFSFLSYLSACERLAVAFSDV